MNDIPVINVPRPFGLFIVAGVMACALSHESTTHRGPITIFQTEPPDPGFYKRANYALLAAAGSKQARHAIRAKLMSCDWGLNLTHGPVGQAVLSQVSDLRAPRCPLKYAHHLNMGYDGLAHRYAWLLSDPVPLGQARETPAHPGGDDHSACPPTRPAHYCDSLF